MSDSPAEYVEELRTQNKILRANVLQLVREKQVLLEQLASVSARLLRLRKETRRVPHDLEP